ncbi:MAG: DUF3120 domain-containing protein [Geminocystis sp.]|nr:DUF3120 domain-containing protein [Geminocystis sp.]MCS7147244.1 DUF3120 domain-containing protein [Geminocystis sp.]MCX8078531.1 DUF3120 domain-containing protein [Geminocystis sp.]MDW8116240.1 DUF3120 domain-containing protein [Geminocystis sp.]MDW8462768.1 DUF3120 domain-containing protein [Geminocystis sp.]
MLPQITTITLRLPLLWWWQRHLKWRILLTGGLLVSIPVFFQAPLVRILPWVSLLLTPLWGIVSFRWRKSHPLWSDLLWGFSLTWFCGSIYWGWFRYYPAIHLPLEGIALPIAIWGILRRWNLTGNYFYLGSLLGTTATDLYFYITGLIPYWRVLMVNDSNPAAPILHHCLARVQTPWGISWAIVLANLLLAVSVWGLAKRETHYFVFSGATIGTIFTDALFLLGIYFKLT